MDPLTLILSIANGIVLATVGAITALRSVATTNVKVVLERLDNCEQETVRSWHELTEERTYTATLYRWAHEAILTATASGVDIGAIPDRPPQTRRYSQTGE